MTESECELPEQFWDEASREGLLYHLEGETQLRKHDALPRNFSFKSQPKLEPPWWQKDVLQYVPPQKKATATKAISRILARIREVTTKAHAAQIVFEAYAEPVFAALKAFDELKLGQHATGRFDPKQRDAIFPDAPTFGLSFNDQKIHLAMAFEREVLRPEKALIFVDDQGNELEYHQLPDAEREQHDKEALSQSRYAAQEWEKLEDWHSQIRRLAELLQASKPENPTGRPDSAYLRVALVKLLKGEKKRQGTKVAKLIGKNMSAKELTKEECEEVVQRLAEMHRVHLQTLPTEQKLERKVILAIVTVLGANQAHKPD